MFFIYLKDIYKGCRSLQKSEMRAKYKGKTMSFGTSSPLEGRQGVTFYVTQKACEPESAKMARTELWKEAKAGKLFQAEGTALAKP